MLQGILDFFKKLFSFLKPTPPPQKPDLPKVDIAEPQDGSEITPDTTVIVVNEEEPIFDEDPPDTFNSPGSTVDTPDQPPPGDPTDTAPPITVEVPPEVVPSPVEEPAPKRQPRFLWCLDNGHGKKTAGKRSPVFNEGQSQFFEYEFNRDIVKRIIEKLKVEGVQYYNVVPEVDTDNFLEGRVARANSKSSDLPKIFLSIHSNAGPAKTPNHWSTASGIETWHFHGSTKGRKLASIFQRHLIKKLKWKNRNIRSQKDRQFYVLRNTNMPAVLTENGFYNNREEVKLLLKDNVRQAIADAHVEAILEIEENGV